MRLTRQTNYALRIMMYCAATPEKRNRVSEIAAAYGLPEKFLFKILQPLVEAGLLLTIRGRSGGIILAKPAEQISILDVVKVTEADFLMAECFDEANTDCPLLDHCELNSALRDALNSFLESLGNRSIASLVKNRADILLRLGIQDSAA